MPEQKHRDVALAIIFCPATHRLLVVTSRKHNGLWIFPKGGVEKGETSGQAAAREAYEEAGIPSKIPADSISPRLLKLEIPFKPGQKKPIWHVHVITLASERDLLEDWVEKEERKRAWLTPKEVLVAFREWGGADIDIGEEEEEESFKRGGKKKKAAKGHAFRLALDAFVEKYGWEKQ